MKIESGCSYSFSDLLYRGECTVCGDVLEWEADFDADGTTYAAWCCGKSYYMRPQMYLVTIEDKEEE